MQESSDKPVQVSVDALTEAVASGVLRALAARGSGDSPFDLDRTIAEQGIFASIVVYAGQWPTGRGSERAPGP